MSKKDLLFFETGVEYYILGRQAAFSQFRISGILFHHSCEMLLKSQLNIRFTKEQLKRNFSHKLIQLWVELKKDFPETNLDIYDNFIHELNLWEEVRYPKDPLNLQSYITWFSQSTKEEWLRYKGSLEEADKFFNKILPLIEKDLFFMREVLFRSVAEEMYKKENKYALW